MALMLNYLNSRRAEDAAANAIVEGPGKEALDPLRLGTACTARSSPIAVPTDRLPLT